MLISFLLKVWSILAFKVRCVFSKLWRTEWRNLRKTCPSISMTRTLHRRILLLFLIMSFTAYNSPILHSALINVSTFAYGSSYSRILYTLNQYTRHKKHNRIKRWISLEEIYTERFGTENEILKYYKDKYKTKSTLLLLYNDIFFSFKISYFIYFLH